MPTTKEVEVKFTFEYIDIRPKYTCKDFGLKSIPYGESDETYADGLPAYQEELSHISDIVRDAIDKFNHKNVGVYIQEPTLSDEWITLYNCDMERGKLSVEVQIAVTKTFDMQFNHLPTEKWKETDVICDKVDDVLKELSSLSNGNAKCDYCGYD